MIQLTTCNYNTSNTISATHAYKIYIVYKVNKSTTLFKVDNSKWKTTLNGFWLDKVHLRIEWSVLLLMGLKPSSWFVIKVVFAVLQIDNRNMFECSSVDSAVRS